MLPRQIHEQAKHEVVEGTVSYITEYTHFEFVFGNTHSGSTTKHEWEHSGECSIFVTRPINRVQETVCPVIPLKKLMGKSKRVYIQNTPIEI